MRFNTLIMRTAVIYTLIIGASLLSYRVFLVYPELKAAALDLQNRNLQSIYSTIESKMNELSILNLKWAKWDETYGYVAAGDPEFVSRNILRPSFLRFDIDAVVIFKKDGSIKYSAEKINEKFTSTQETTSISSELNISKILNNENQQGLITFNGNLAYFSSNPIQDSEYNYKSNGAIVFIRVIKDAFFRKVRLLTDLQVHFKKPEYMTTLQSNEGLLPFKNSKITTLHPTYYIPLSNHLNTTAAIMRISSDHNKIPSILDGSIILTTFVLALLPIILTLVIGFIFITPITQIFSQIKRMEENGSISFISYRSNILEFDRFTAQFNALVEKIHSYQLELKKDSLTDGLTGIPNRRQFDKRFDESWRFSVRNQSPICIIMIDIDYFKKYNDHYGHQAGDDILILVANELNKYIRRSSDLLARYGGEEFIAIVKTSSEEELIDVLKTIRACIINLKIEHEHSETAPYISISAGACLIDNPGLWMKDKIQTAIKVADQALYRAKSNGRNRFEINYLADNEVEIDAKKIG